MTFDKATIAKILDNPLGFTDKMSHRKFILKANIAIYHRQTLDEKMEGDTKHTNGRGYNSADALFMSKMANYALKGYTIKNHTVHIIAKRLKKYAGQLVIVVNEKKAA